MPEGCFLTLLESPFAKSYATNLKYKEDNLWYGSSVKRYRMQLLAPYAYAVMHFRDLFLFSVYLHMVFPL